MKFLFGIIIGVLLVTAGAAWLDGKVGPEVYAAAKPELKPNEFFDGQLQSWGFFQPLGLPVEQRFTMHARASWYDDKGSMHEYFTFNDGTKKEREWTFTMVDAHHFIGTAPDVIGRADGEAYGNSLHWVYTIILPVKGHDVAVKFDDWLYLIDDTHMFSRVAVSKFGLPVGEMTMFFEKPGK